MINKIEYFEDVTSAKEFISSSDSKTLKKFTKDIDIAVKKLEFEKAAEIRDRLNRLELIKKSNQFHFIY